MLSKKENIFWEYVMDRGFGSVKVQGLFSNSAGRRGIGQSKPLDRVWMDQIRRWGVRVDNGELDGGARPDFSMTFTNSAIGTTI
jgi:hypothetical protein